MPKPSVPPKARLDVSLAGLSMSTGGSLKSPRAQAALAVGGITRSPMTSESLCIASQAADAGWTQVGKAVLSPKTPTSIKLSANNGLAKLQVKSRSRFGALGTSYVEECDEYD
jgi:hypothetical protein